jgi:ribonuclease HII
MRHPDRDRIVVGVDEVGRGPLAGPVVAAAVALPISIDCIGDSKTLGARKRRFLYARIRAEAHVGVGAASVGEIDQINILQASLLAMQRAVVRLGIVPDEILVDGNRLPDWHWPSRAIVGGDAKVAEIGAASIVAKVVRDRLMRRLAEQFPVYGWDRNAGYPTRAHVAALECYGVTRHHRRSFAPVRARLDIEVDGGVLSVS